MKLKLLLAAATLSLAAATAANAGTYDLGTLVDGVTSTVSTATESAGMNTDMFTFNITSPFEVLSTGAFTNSGGFSITEADLKLYSSSGTFEGGVDYDPKTQPSQSIDATLATGSYYILAKTTATGTGSFTVNATPESVSAAPEPSTWAFMIAGLAMVGGMLRLGRRNGWSMTAA